MPAPLSSTAREHLQLIQRYNAGRLLPTDVLQDAKNPNSPLHDLFIWDDSAAAHAYRLLQAVSLIRVVVRVSQPRRESTRIVVRAYTPSAQSRYEPQPDDYPSPGSQSNAALDNRAATLSLSTMMREIVIVCDRYQSLDACNKLGRLIKLVIVRFGKEYRNSMAAEAPSVNINDPL